MPINKGARKRNVRATGQAGKRAQKEAQPQSDESSMEETSGGEKTEKKRGRKTLWLENELKFLNEQLPAYWAIPKGSRRSEEMRTFKARVTQMYIDKFEEELGDRRVRQMTTVCIHCALRCVLC